MRRAPGRTDLRHFLAIAPFALACFPSRGLYFLLHPAAPYGRYHTHHPVLGAPTQPTPRLKAAKVPLPARLTRVPRALKKTPAVPAPAAASAPAIMTVGRTPRPIRSFSRPIGNHEPHGSSLFSGKGFTVAAVQGNGRPSHGGVMPILTMAIMAFAVLFFIRRG